MSELPALTKEQARFAARGLVVVKTLAHVFARQWPAVHESDFVSAGHEAAVKAAARFNPDMGVPFEQFAKHAIWGVMLDLAHRETFVVQGTIKRIARAMSETVVIEQSTDAWLEEPSVDAKDEVIANIRARMAGVVAASFAGGTKPLTAEDAAIDEQERRISLARLRAGMGTLDEKERAFVSMYYDEELTLEDAAKRMGVVKRTVQRMHDRIKTKLAAALLADTG